MTEAQHNKVQQAFDRVAADFDRELENDITRRLRGQVYLIAERYIIPGGRILDINCGTGIDALHFLERGFLADVNDISPHMLYQARAKIERRFPGTSFTNLSFTSLDALPEHSYDMVFSNFGGLNCIEDLSKVAEQSAKRLKPGGFFTGIAMPRVSAWEISSGLLRGDPGRAFQRFRKEVTATGFKGTVFNVFYHSVHSAIQAFRPWFRVRTVVGLSILSPPPHATGFRETNPALSRALEWLDERLGTLPVIRGLGDHWLVVFERTPD